jgi:hypothetical protein
LPWAGFFTENRFFPKWVVETEIPFLDMSVALQLRATPCKNKLSMMSPGTGPLFVGSLVDQNQSIQQRCIVEFKLVAIRRRSIRAPGSLAGFQPSVAPHAMP